MCAGRKLSQERCRRAQITVKRLGARRQRDELVLDCAVLCPVREGGGGGGGQQALTWQTYSVDPGWMPRVLRQCRCRPIAAWT